METPVQATRPAPAREKRFPKRRRVFALAPFVVIAVGAAFLGAVAYVPEGQVAPGVRVGDLELGGKSLAEARAALEQWGAQRQEALLALRFPPETQIKRVWKAKAGELGLGINVAATLDAVEKAGHEGMFAQIAHRLSGPKTVPVAPHLTIQEEKLRARLKQIAQVINRKAVNARFRILPGGFGLNREKPGLTMDMAASVAAVTQAWEREQRTEGERRKEKGESRPPIPPNLGGAGGPITQSPNYPTTQLPDALNVELVAKVTQADILAADLKQIDGELVSFSSYYKGIPNRLHNVELAAGRINGTLLRPGAVFSYNKTVGPRDEDHGFRVAPEIVKGRHAMGIGGGVCQVSSTLYNAVLRADLKIVQRQHHAFPIGYLPAGCDATVVYGSIDFQFQNDTKAPVYIGASADRRHRRLNFRIFGKTIPGRKVGVQVVTHGTQPTPVQTIKDPTLRAGRTRVEEKGTRGIRLSVYRVIHENGTVTRKLVSHDTYRPSARILVVGTKPVPGKTKPASGQPPTTPQPGATTPNPPPTTGNPTTNEIGTRG